MAGVVKQFETALGASTPDKITLLGQDLAQDVMGEVGFGELAFWLATRGAEEWFGLLVDAGVPCGPINTIDGGFAMAEKFGLEPVVQAGEGERALPVARHPITFSATPADYPLPPPELDEHGAELRKWLAS